MNSLNKIALATLAVTLLMPAVGRAADSKNQGYLVDSSGNIVMSGTGLCWHTIEWTPARAVEGCDPVARPVALAPAPAPAAPMVAQAAPQPAAPVLIAQPVPAKPAFQKMSFSADALFAFDKFDLKPEGKLMLDDLVRRLGGSSYETITAVGHADRFGSPVYNQRLSERRAGSVKDYLVSKSIPANRIEASGVGESQPVTPANECLGKRSAKVIACLQQDRRVDVDMKGNTPVIGTR